MSGKAGQDHFTMGRPFKVFVAGLFSFFVLVIGGLYAQSLDNPGQIYTLVATLVAAPPLFVVWKFRNEDKQQDIENVRTDNLQKDFHQVQKWATKSGDDVSDALQIAAIHQLKPYLLREYGARFQRPTFAIFKVLLDEWIDTMDDKEFIEQPKKIPPYISAIHTIIREIVSSNAEYLSHFDSTFSFTELNLCWADLHAARFQRSGRSWMQLTDTDLGDKTWFDLADKGWADLIEPNLNRAKLVGANLRASDFTATSLSKAHLSFADLSNSRLHNTDLSGAWIDNANLSHTQINEETYFGGTIYSDNTIWWDQSFDPKRDSRFVHISEWLSEQEEPPPRFPS